MNEQLSLDLGTAKVEDAMTDRQTDRQTDKPPQTYQEKVDKAREALKLAAEMSKIYYHKPLIVTYSGGKDSDVILHLAESNLAPSDFEVLNSHTTVDAPETVYHIRETFKRLHKKGIKAIVDYHKNEDGTNTTMWSLIEKKCIPPTRIIRYCCAELKENSTPNRFCALGVRAAESTKRQGRDIFTTRGGATQVQYFFH